MGKCIRLLLRILLELMWAGRRRKRRKTATTSVVFPHSFAGYKANHHEFKFILSIKWCSEIGIHELPTFVMPEWPTENSHLSSLKFHLPLSAAWSLWAPQAVPECQRQSSLPAACVTAGHPQLPAPPALPMDLHTGKILQPCAKGKPPAGSLLRQEWVKKPEIFL